MRKLVSLLIIFGLFTGKLFSQGCPMCKAAVESNLDAGGADSVGNGLNTGILYLMVIPYVMIVLIGVFWYRAKKKQDRNAPRYA